MKTILKQLGMMFASLFNRTGKASSQIKSSQLHPPGASHNTARKIAVGWSPDKDEFKITPRINNGAKKKSSPLLCRAHDRPVEMKFAHNAKTHRGHDAKIYECLQCGRYDVVGVNFATGAPMILSSGFNQAAKGKVKEDAHDWTPGMATVFQTPAKAKLMQVHRMAAVGICLALICFATAAGAAPPTPTSPSPGTTSSPGPTTANSTVTLSWGASSGATYYDVGVRDIATGTLVVNTTTTATSYTASLTAGKQYRWNVAAGNATGESAFTTVLYFQTPAAVVIPPTPTSPSPGTTSSPGPTTASSTVTLSWGASSGATFYDIGVRDIATGNLVVNTTTTATSYTVTLTAGKQYKWNVAADNSAGESAFTAVQYFQTPAAIPPTPTSPSPGTTSSPGPTMASSTVTLSWNAVAGATYYDVGVRDIATGNLVVNTTTTATSYTATLTAGGQFKWNVAAGNSAGESSFTTVQYFQTPAVIPPTPANPSPGTTSSPGPTMASNTVTLSWNAVAGATYYDVGVRDIATGNLVVNTTTTATSYTATLTAGGQFKWNVAAGNSAGESSFTTVQYFQTPAVIPPTPANPSPGTTGSPGPTMASNTVMLSWNAVAGATYYDVGVRDIATGNLVVNTTTTATSYTAVLTAGKQYRWNVAAGNTAGESAFTTVLYFQTPTDVVIPATPTSPSPGTTSSPGPTTASNTVTFSWSAVTGATYYDVGVRDIATGNLIVNTTTTATSYTVALTAGKQYRWNVAAGNTAGESAFTTVLYFQTPGVFPAALVTGTQGLGLRLRANPNLSATILAVMPEGSAVGVLGDTQTGDGILFWHIQYGAQQGWAASQFLVMLPTTQSPAAPINLSQLQFDGITLIANGGSANGDSVMLAATTSGSSAQQFKVQFEVRPSTTSFSSPTHDSGFVQGGSAARVTVSSLGSQSYIWRARVLNASGQASDWVVGQTFIVNAPQPLSALFQWSPTLVSVGQSVQFAAQASGTGLSFQWNFGDGQSASGATVSHTFSQAGQVTVQLTVSSAQGNSQHSETMTISSQQLSDSINQFVQRADNLLDGILIQAQQTADSADYFQNGADKDATKASVGLILDTIGLGLPDVEFKGKGAELLEWTKSALGPEAAQIAQSAIVESSTAAEKSVLDWIIGQHFANQRSYVAIYIPNIQAVITLKKSELELLRQQALSAAALLTPQQADQYARNLQARYAGNIALADSYGRQAGLPITFADLKRTDEQSWSLTTGEQLFDVSYHVAKIAVTLEGNPTGIIAELGSFGASMAQNLSDVSSTTLDKLRVIAAQPASEQMLMLSLQVLGQSALTTKAITDNTKHGLEAIKNSQSPSVPVGQMTVEHVAEGLLQQFAFGRRWFANAAYAKITLRNPGTTPTEYRVEASYPKTFTTTQVFPHNALGIGERSYPIYVASIANGIVLNPGEEKVIQLNYRSPQGGEVPEGPISYTLTTKTVDGNYLVAFQSQAFGTTLIDTNGVSQDHSQLQDVLLAATPVRSSKLQFGASKVCNFTIFVRNPLESPLPINLQQPLPPGTSIIDAAGGTTNGNQLSWELDLLPGESRCLQLTLRLPSDQSVLADTQLAVYDAVNATWLQFHSMPTTVQVQDWPASQLEATGLTSNGFAMSVRHYVPGVYRVEWTTNFITWNPLQISTNSQGVIQIQDAGAASNPSRFYRTVKVE